MSYFKRPIIKVYNKRGLEEHKKRILVSSKKYLRNMKLKYAKGFEWQCADSFTRIRSRRIWFYQLSSYSGDAVVFQARQFSKEKIYAMWIWEHEVLD